MSSMWFYMPEDGGSKFLRNIG